MITESKKLSGILLSLIVLAIFVLPAYAQPNGTPQIIITAPKNGNVISAGDVTIYVNVSNFNIVDKQGQASVAGEGHIHYFMDMRAPTTPGQPAVTPDDTYVHTTSTSYTWKDVIPGNHSFSAELVNNDHTPLIPPAVDVVNVLAVGTSSGAKVTSGSIIYGPKNVATNVSAINSEFNTTTITVPAGANVTINFDNRDTGVSHNIAVYENQDAKNPIYVGKTTIGPAKVAYIFTAPSKPGNYYFRDDVHPLQMRGSFVAA